MDDTINRRIQEFDVAKGIGIILVILGHALPEESYWRLVIYSFHMPLFFFLSGAVIKFQKDSISLKDSVVFERKLLITYIFYSGVFLIFDILVRLVILHRISIRGIIWDCYETATFFGINVLWFLASLVIGKIIVRRLMAFKLARGIKSFIMILLLFFIPCIIARNIPNPTTEWQRLFWYPIIAILRAVVASSYILSGYVMKDKIRNAINKFNISNSYKIGVGYTLLLICVILSSCYLLNNRGVIIDMHVMNMGIIPVTLMLSYVGIIGVILCSALLCRVRRIKNFFLFWGINSLFVMVTHEYLLIKDILKWIIGCFGFYIDDAFTPIVYALWIMLIEIVLIKLVSKRIKALIDKCFIHI